MRAAHHMMLQIEKKEYLVKRPLVVQKKLHHFYNLR